MEAEHSEIRGTTDRERMWIDILPSQIQFKLKISYLVYDTKDGRAGTVYNRVGGHSSIRFGVYYSST
jgi:hypothetical protein